MVQIHQHNNMIPYDSVDDHLLSDNSPPGLNCIDGIKDVTIIRDLQRFAGFVDATSVHLSKYQLTCKHPS